ncbi:hypothetical protein HJFPF1_03080 [Paramyrothecium foliicola]|nr:hypothetical protein HJFPF1_03080 [Paramyrothecium foliicola]
MASADELEPPQETKVADPGAHQLAESSDSEDQFTDARSYPISPSVTSPIPKTRIEKVDNEPAYGEVPGTQAYKKREGDAEPDEIAIIPEHDMQGPDSDSATPVPIPVTVVEEAPGDQPGKHTEEFESKREADAAPDVVLKSYGEDEGSNGAGTTDETLSPAILSPSSPKLGRKSSARSLRSASSARQDEEDAADDDFDDFEEGAGDDDFDDFEDGFQEPAPASPPPAPSQFNQAATLPFPIPDFDSLGPDDIMSETEPYLATLFPPEELDLPAFPTLAKDSSIFLTPRSASLWSQLVAPPPLAPPDWIRSRTRRLFLVSLGVPVDLDEILPASKQKKLVLPSLNLPSASPRTSTDSRSVSRLKQGEGNASSTSVDTQGKPNPSRKRRGPPPQPELDLVAARHLCMATDEALDGMTNDELKEHVAKLEAMQGTAKEVLEYWQKRTDEKIGDREAFEGVIENLVKHARKVRT